jgi:macrolide-specific efflux system membrane fusion protein
MSANVVIVENVVENALLVPSAAVRRAGRQSTVTVAKPDGTREQRVVVTGGTDNTNTAITSGLTEGEKVVVGGTTAVPTGAAGGAGGAGPGGPGRPPTPAGGVR